MNKSVRIFSSPLELAETFANEMMNMIRVAKEKGNNFSIALSGGNTPKILFSVLSDNFSSSADWSHVHLFWGDERCVPPDHPDSNYGMTRQALLQRINIPENNIHRIRGEANPSAESQKYSKEIENNTRSRNGLPSFDLIILGLGNDGHTASIFPGDEELFWSKSICAVALHPETQGKRITLTGTVVNNAENVVFLVSGKDKAEIIHKIFEGGELRVRYPASLVAPACGKVTWFLDRDAAGLLH